MPENNYIQVLGAKHMHFFFNWLLTSGDELKASVVLWHEHPGTMLVQEG